MPEWFKKAGKSREDIVYKQKKRIMSVYRNMFFEVRNIFGSSVARQGSLLPRVIRKVYFQTLERTIGDAVEDSVSEIGPIVRSNMKTVSSAVIDDNKELLQDVGFDEHYLEMFEESRDEREEKIISMITSGKFYDKKWTLDGFIKQERDKIMADVRKIISVCVENDMEIGEVYNSLENYFNPDREKRSKFFVMFPGVKRKISYDSIRTGNTMVGHAYEETFVNVTMFNPFIEGYRWITSGSDRVCPVCIDRESTDKFGLGVGIFPKDQLPLDHPNGMCTFDPVYIMSDGEIIREIDAWMNGTGNMKNQIENWVESFSKK